MSLPRLKNYPTEGPLTLASGGTYVIDLGEKSSNFLRIASASAAFRIRIDDTHEIAVTAGKKFNTLPNKFSKIEVINNSGGALTFLLEIGTGEVSSDEVVVSGTVNTSDAAVLASLNAEKNNVIQAATEVTVSAGATSNLLGGAANQTGGFIQNIGFVDLYIATSTVAATVIASGIVLQPGEGLAVDGKYILRGAVVSGSTKVRYQRFGTV